MDTFEKEISKSLIKHLDIEAVELEVPPSQDLGDYAFACFPLAKKLKKAPAKIAEDLAQKIKPGKIIRKVEAEGPYLNFFINREELFKTTIKEIDKQGSAFGRIKGKTERVMVEFSSPNTNKPLHLGHLRNISIGESISRIFEKNNDKVFRTCIVNDRGIHIIKSILAYMEKGDSRKPDKKPDHFVGDFYVEYARLEKNNPKYADKAKQMLKKWENNDKQLRKVWKTMNNWVYEGFNQTYKKLGISFDKTYYESEIYEKAKEIVMKALTEGKLVKEEGAVMAKLEDHGLPDKVLIRSDGTSIYMTQDIYLAQKKFQDFNLDKSIYVVATEQNLHFKQLFAILELLGFEWAKECYHLAYGMVYLPEGKMKSREGLVVDADNIIEELETLARKELEGRYKLSSTEMKKRSEKIALAALKFHLLKHDPYKDMTYDPKESISFQGETGPYVQYTYARIQSILDKSKENSLGNNDFSLLEHDLEWELIKNCAQFPSAVANAKRSLKPSVIARYLLDLCQAFNEYYHEVPILRASNELKKSRLALISALQQVIGNSLDLLGIDTLKKM